MRINIFIFKGFAIILLGHHLVWQNDYVLFDIAIAVTVICNHKAIVRRAAQVARWNYGFQLFKRKHWIEYMNLTNGVIT